MYDEQHGWVLVGADEVDIHVQPRYRSKDAIPLYDDTGRGPISAHSHVLGPAIKYATPLLHAPLRLITYARHVSTRIIPVWSVPGMLDFLLEIGCVVH